MAAARVPRQRHSLSEKRRIVELVLREGSSIVAIARGQGIHPNSLRRWKALYRMEELSSASALAARTAGTTLGTLVPVTITPDAPVARSLAESPCILQITLSRGSTLRIETGALNGELLCALVAQLQR